MPANPSLRKESRVLFVCIGNASRSQMGEAFAKSYGYQSSSAGTKPAPAVNPVAVEVMREKKIDMSSHRPKMVTLDMIEDADLVVTMGCSIEKVCPRPLLSQMQKNLIDWDLENPRDKPIEKVREIRDDIEKRVRNLFAEV